MPGVLVVKSPPASDQRQPRGLDATFQSAFPNPNSQIRLIILADDAEFAARSLDDFLWVTFTRSNPAADVHGVNAFTEDKHWGCFGPLIIDARLKPHHAPPLEEDPAVTRRVEALATNGGPLQGVI